MTTTAAPPAGALARGQQPSFTLMDVIRKRSDVIARVIPKHMNPERLVALFQIATSRNPKLGECTAVSVVNSVIKAGQLGLECSGATGEAYLVPYYNGRTKQRECQLQTGYKGLVKLAKNAGRTTSVEARAVYEKDQFDYEFGLIPRLVHRPWDDDATRGKLLFVYAVARFKEGDPQFDVMSKIAVDKIRARSQSRDNGPWVTDYDEMAKKTVVRRLSKMLDQSPEVAQQLAEEDEADRGDMIDPMPSPTDALNRMLQPPPLDPPYEPAGEGGGEGDSQIDPAVDQAAERSEEPAPADPQPQQPAPAAPAAAPTPTPVDAEAQAITDREALEQPWEAALKVLRSEAQQHLGVTSRATFLGLLAKLAGFGITPQNSSVEDRIKLLAAIRTKRLNVQTGAIQP